MPDTFTPNYNLTKPEIGSSRDAWGGKWNGNADAIDTAMKANADAVANIVTVPPGMMADFAMAAPPAGWLKCNGAAISRTTYAALFALIGTTYGPGDGATTFNLPDIRGYFRRSLDDGRGVDSGRALGAIQADDNKAHTHNLDGGGSVVQLYGSGALVYLTVSNTTNPGYHAANIASSGGAEARPKNIAFPTFIKY